MRESSQNLVTIIYELSAAKHCYLEKNSKSFIFNDSTQKNMVFYTIELAQSLLTMIFELSAAKHSYREKKFQKSFIFNESTQKNMVFYMIELAQSLLTKIFELNQQWKKNHDFPKKLNFFENTHENRLFSRISTFVENLNYFRKSELISKSRHNDFSFPLPLFHSLFRFFFLSPVARLLVNVS